MRTEVRRKLEMGERVLVFSRDHSSDDPSYVILLGRLEDRVARGDALAAQERAGRSAEQAATDRRNGLRRDMHFQTLRHLVQAGVAAAKEKPELAGKFQLRSTSATNKAFLVSAKAMLADGQANKDLLVAQGLSSAMLDQLATALTQFEEASRDSKTARTSHVGARADLSAVTEEIVEVVNLLDTFNRFRFRDDPELAAAWESARTADRPFRRSPRTNGTPAAPAAPPVEGKDDTPPTGGLAPAA
jgi:hypothetical protein